MQISPWKCYLAIIGVTFMKRNLYKKWLEMQATTFFFFFYKTHNSSAPYRHLRELHVISHCCKKADCSLCCWWPFLAHITMCETFDNHNVLCFISNCCCTYFIYTLCAFCIVKTNGFTQIAYGFTILSGLPILLDCSRCYLQSA